MNILRVGQAETATLKTESRLLNIIIIMKQSSFLFSIVLLLSGAFSYGNNSKTELGSSNKEQLNCSKNQTATQVSVMNFRDDVPPVNSPLNRESVVSGSSVSNVSSKNKRDTYPLYFSNRYSDVAFLAKCIRRTDKVFLWYKICYCDEIILTSSCGWVDIQCRLQGGWLIYREVG